MKSFCELLNDHITAGTSPPGKERSDWQQKQFAGECGVTEGAVRAWQLGTSRPRIARMRKIAAVFFGLNKEKDTPHYAAMRDELWRAWRIATKPSDGIVRDAVPKADTCAEHLGEIGEDAASPPVKPVASGPTTDRIMLLPTGVPLHLTGRGVTIDRIADILGQVSDRPAVVALVGIRGVGKSTLAAAYANKNRARYKIIWTVNARAADTIQASLKELGARINRAGDGDVLDVQKVGEFLNRQENDVLIIFDNARHPDAVWPYLPQGGASHVLITSNVEAWDHMATTEPVKLLTAEEGGDYLLLSSGRKKKETLASAMNLAIALERLTLALRMSAAYIQVQGISFSDYLEIFETAPIKILGDQNFPIIEYYGGETVAQALFLNVAEATRIHPAAGRVITYLALLGPHHIPLALFDNVSAGKPKQPPSVPDNEGDISDEELLRDLVAKLDNADGVEVLRGILSFISNKLDSGYKEDFDTEDEEKLRSLITEFDERNAKSLWKNIFNGSRRNLLLSVISDIDNVDDVEMTWKAELKTLICESFNFVDQGKLERLTAWLESTNGVEKPSRRTFTAEELKDAVKVLRRFCLLMDDDDTTDENFGYNHVRLHGLVRLAALAPLEREDKEQAKTELASMLRNVTFLPAMQAIGHHYEFNVGRSLDAEDEPETSLTNRSADLQLTSLDYALYSQMRRIIDDVCDAPEWKSRRSRRQLEWGIIPWLMQVKWGPMLHFYD